jgi:hypothetical protein
VSVSISQLELRLDQTHYASLLSLLKVVKTSTNKSEIMERSTKRALVFLKEKNWKKVLATISEGYMYFWEKKEFPLAAVRIRKVLASSDSSKSNSILVSDREGNNFLVAFDSSNVMEQWLSELQKIATLQYE